MPAAQRRQSLLDTATELLEQGGSDALRMDALAKAAGVTRPVVYEHFGDREGLIIALIQRHGARLRQQISEALAEATSFEDELARSVRAYLAEVREHGAALRALLRSVGVSPEIERTRAGIWTGGNRRWAARYREEFKLTAKDAEAMASFHLHGLWSLADQWLAGKLSARRVEQLHVATVLGSLREVSRLPAR